MIKKKVNMFLLMLMLVVSCAILGTSITLSWLGGSNELKPIIGSTVITQYFESGTGTEDDPFIIHSPRHLYNFAWLQYMGQFNSIEKDKDGNPVIDDETGKPKYKQYYFELCDGENKYAEGHDDSGIKESGLDMDGWLLPPIGTAKFPFLGSFDGNGIAISNLVVTSDYSKLSDQALPETSDGGLLVSFADGAYDSNNGAADIVGLFGVIGSIDGDAGTITTAGGGSAVYSSQVNAVRNLYVENVTVETRTNTSLIGIVAGYVNGTLENVGVVNSSLELHSSDSLNRSVITGKVSNYTLVGYCTDDYLGIGVVAERTVEGPEESENAEPLTDNDIVFGNAWGGSVDMKTMYTRLSELKNSASRNPITSEKVDVYSDGSTTSITTEITRNTGANLGNRNNFNLLNYYGDNGGTNVTFVNRTNVGDNYLYITDIAEGQYTYKNQETTEITYTSDGSFTISYLDGHHYLSTKGNDIVNVEGTSDDTPQAWFSEGSAIYKKVGDDNKFYLNVDPSGNLILSENQTTLWTKGTNSLSCTIDGVRKYLCYENGEWSVAEKVTQYVLSDGEGNFLSWTGTAFARVGSADSATKWSTKNEYLNIAGTGNYLNFDGTNLSISSTRGTKWINDGTSVYCVVGGTPYYITYADSEWKAVRPPDYIRRIHNGNNYLCLSNGNVTNVFKTGDLSDITEWVFEPEDSYHYRVYTKVGNIIYYLSAPNITEGQTGNIGITTDRNAAQIWMWDPSVDNGELKFAHNNYNVYKYLRLNGSTWIVDFPAVSYRISNLAETHFLSVANNKIADRTSAAQATLWKFSNQANNYNNPTGKIFSGSNYLKEKESNNDISLTLTNNTDNEYTTFSNNNGALYIFHSGRGCNGNAFIKYNNGWTASTGTQQLKVTPVQNAYSLTFDNIQPNLPEARFSEVQGIPVLEFLPAGYSTSSQPVVDGKALAHVTYFPISAMDAAPYSPLPQNTGYVISGSNETTSVYKSDIRVSRYGLSDVSASVGNTYNKNTVKIITVNPSNGDFKILSDPEEGVTVSGNVGNVSAYSNVSTLGLQKFRNSKDGLNTLLTNASYVYGLHFMNAQISASNKIKASKAVINGKTFANYELPKDCIDCNLRTQGYINFFAGTYYSSDVDAFFSLHKIERNNVTNNITAIREIDKIYKPAGNGTGEYIYKYVNEAEPKNHGDLIFDMSWVTNTMITTDDDGSTTSLRVNLVQHALYYFEIPVNAGEYALGSVSGKTGAYLIYLDISANAVYYEKNAVTTTDAAIISAYEYPLGVDVVESKDSPIGVVSSAVASIKAGANGNVLLTRVGTTNVAFTLSSGAAASDIASTYQARLNTDTAENAAELAIGKIRSSYATKSAILMALGGSVDSIEYTDLLALPVVTIENQYIDGDVVLSDTDNVIVPAPLFTQNRLTVSRYYNYYRVDVLDRELAGTTIDDPETDTILKSTSNDLYDMLGVQAQAAPKKKMLKTNAMNNALMYGASADDSSSAWVNHAPPEDNLETIGGSTIDDSTQPLSDIEIFLESMSDDEIFEALQDDSADDILLEMVEDEALLEKAIKRFSEFKSLSYFNAVKARLKVIFADDPEVLDIIAGIQAPEDLYRLFKPKKTLNLY